MIDLIGFWFCLSVIIGSPIFFVWLFLLEPIIDREIKAISDGRYGCKYVDNLCDKLYEKFGEPFKFIFVGTVLSSTCVSFLSVIHSFKEDVTIIHALSIVAETAAPCFGVLAIPVTVVIVYVKVFRNPLIKFFKIKAKLDKL